MKPKELIRHVALFSCVYYTAATFLILFIYFLISFDLSRGVRATALVAILPFAVFFAAANAIYRHTFLKKGARLLIHYLLTIGGAMLFLYLPNRDAGQGAESFLKLLLVLSLLYGVVMTLILLISARAARVRRDTAEYNEVYKD